MSFNNNSIKLKPTTSPANKSKTNDESNAQKPSANIKVASSISEKLKKFSSSNDSSSSSSTSTSASPSNNTKTLISKTNNSTNGRDLDKKPIKSNATTTPSTNTSSNTANLSSPKKTISNNNNNNNSNDDNSVTISVPLPTSPSKNKENSESVIFNNSVKDLTTVSPLLAEEEDTNSLSIASSSMTNSSANPLNTSGSEVEGKKI